MNKKYKLPKKSRVVRWDWIDHDWAVLPVLIANYGWLDFETNNIVWDQDVSFFHGGRGITMAELEKMAVRHAIEINKQLRSLEKKYATKRKTLEPETQVC